MQIIYYTCPVIGEEISKMENWKKCDILYIIMSLDTPTVAQEDVGLEIRI